MVRMVRMVRWRAAQARRRLNHEPETEPWAPASGALASRHWSDRFSVANYKAEESWEPEPWQRQPRPHEYDGDWIGEVYQGEGFPSGYNGLRLNAKRLADSKAVTGHNHDYSSGRWERRDTLIHSTFHSSNHSEGREYSGTDQFKKAMRLKYETLGANFLQDRYTPEELKSHWVNHKAEMQSAELRAQEYLLTKNGATVHQVEWEGLEHLEELEGMNGDDFTRLDESIDDSGWDEKNTHRYKPGPAFIRNWDIEDHENKRKTYHTSDWSDTYDQNAQYVRAQNPHGLDVPMLMTELLPTAEYADDMLPFCSDWSSATFRISNMRRWLMRLGGVKLNMGKLKFMLPRRPQKFRITSKQIEDYSRKRTDWHECQFCKRREPCKSSMMQHQRYCKHPSRDPVDLSASGKPMKYCVKKIEDCAGPPGNRWYLVRWSHPYDPSPGVMPGDKGYVHWSPRAQDGPGYPSSWEHECNVGDGSKRAIVAYFASIHKPGFGESKACEDPNSIQTFTGAGSAMSDLRKLASSGST